MKLFLSNGNTMKNDVKYLFRKDLVVRPNISQSLFYI